MSMKNKSCEPLYNKIFKDIKLVDLQTVIDTCGKNFPTLKKIKVLFNQLFDYALKNDICNKGRHVDNAQNRSGADECSNDFRGGQQNYSA